MSLRGILTVANHPSVVGLSALGLQQPGRILTAYAIYTPSDGSSAILTQTDKVQGDLERTLNSTTNQARRMTSRWEEQQAILGSALIPTYNVFLGTLGDLLDTGDDVTESTQNIANAIALGAKAWIIFDLVANETFVAMFKGFTKLEGFIASTLRSIASIDIDLPLGINIKIIEKDAIAMRKAAGALELQVIKNTASFGAWEEHGEALSKRLGQLDFDIMSLGDTANRVANQPPPIPGPRTRPRRPPPSRRQRRPWNSRGALSHYRDLAQEA